MGLSIRRAVWPEERAGLMRVRMEVFVKEQGVPAEEEPDAHDAEAVHFAVEEDGRVVGTARYVSQPDGVAKIGRVALLPAYRKCGIGRDLMRYVMAAALCSHEVLVLDAQIQALGFYGGLGFRAFGPVFQDGGIGHRRMELRR